jgi:hypothetical protein
MRINELKLTVVVQALVLWGRGSHRSLWETQELRLRAKDRYVEGGKRCDGL